MNIPGAIRWCEICNNAPSDGVLEVIRSGERDWMQACNACVSSLDKDDWLGEVLPSNLL